MQNKELENLFQAFIDNELDDKDREKIENYIKNNSQAKKIYNELKQANNDIKNAYNEFKDHPNDEFINSLIENYPIADNLNKNKNFLDNVREILSKFSFINFAGGAAIASFIGFFAFNVQINTMQYAMSENDINKLYFNEIARNDIEKVFSKKNRSVSSKIKDLEDILNSNNFKKQIPAQISNKSKNNELNLDISDLKFIVKQSEQDENCIEIQISNKNSSVNRKFCNKNNNWELTD